MDLKLTLQIVGVVLGLLYLWLEYKANIWLWGMKDFIILCIAVLISVALLVKFGWLIPAAITLCYAFLTIRKDELTILDFIKYAFRYFITAQQYYEWR